MENQAKNANQEEKGEFSFYQALKEMLTSVNSRSWNIISARYGLDRSQSKTLEGIGREHKITRERVRQIIQEIFKKVKAQKDSSNLHKVRDEIRFTIDRKNGIIEEQELVAFAGKGKKEEEAAIRFFLECLENIVVHKKEKEIKKSFAHSDFSFNDWRKIKNLAKDILEKEKTPLLGNDLHKKVKSLADLEIDAEKLYHWLSVSEELKKNPFGKWGIAAWEEITPRNTREKAYLILKEAGEPLHFTKIAELIDKYKLSKKKTHRQTVHNELIKDNRFVLVGRGTYGLAEWGYKTGTVREILEEILKKSGRPMKREEIINEVLKERQVKKSTVLINLNNFFARAGKGEYSLK